MLLFTLYTGPKPPSPNFLLFEKLSVALTMTTKSNNIANSISSFPPSLSQSFLSFPFIIPERTRDPWAWKIFDNYSKKANFLPPSNLFSIKDLLKFLSYKLTIMNQLLSEFIFFKYTFVSEFLLPYVWDHSNYYHSHN